jgi:hypothetical protein
MARQSEVRQCRHCGADYKAVPGSSVVNCPKHRTRRGRLQEQRGSRIRYEKARPGERCTIGPSATTGKRCGRPGVVAFDGSDGERLVECDRHAPASALAQVRGTSSTP